MAVVPMSDHSQTSTGERCQKHRSVQFPDPEAGGKSPAPQNEKLGKAMLFFADITKGNDVFDLVFVFQEPAVCAIVDDNKIPFVQIIPFV